MIRLCNLEHNPSHFYKAGEKYFDVLNDGWKMQPGWPHFRMAGPLRPGQNGPRNTVVLNIDLDPRASGMLDRFIR